MNAPHEKQIDTTAAVRQRERDGTFGNFEASRCDAPGVKALVPPKHVNSHQAGIRGPAGGARPKTRTAQRRRRPALRNGPPTSFAAAAQLRTGPLKAEASHNRVSDSEAERLDNEVAAEVEDAIAFAESSPEPPLDSVYENVFS